MEATEKIFTAKQKEQIFWKRKNGDLINIDDMEIDHLRNALKMVIRKANAYQKKRIDNIGPLLTGDISNMFNDDTPGDECDASEIDLY